MNHLPMLVTTDYLDVRMAAVRSEIGDIRRSARHSRGSPTLRTRLARLLVMSGARLIRDTPVVIDDRVVILSPSSTTPGERTTSDRFGLKPAA